MRGSAARRVASLLAFAMIYSLFVILGLILRENSQHLTTLWPAAGLLFMTLWFSPRRNWLWILGLQVLVELIIDGLRSDHFTWRQYGPYILANSLDAVVGALVAGRLMSTPEIPRVRHVLLFLAAVATGAAASATFGAFGSARPLEGAHYLREWQVWWAGNWLGSLSVAPVIMSWAVRWRLPQMSAPAARSPEMVLIGCAFQRRHDPRSAVQPAGGGDCRGVSPAAPLVYDVCRRRRSPGVILRQPRLGTLCRRS